MSAAETFRAFPSSAIDDLHGGMSLSDWFAGQALAGLTACPTMRNMKNADYARVSYALADAMMTERGKPTLPDHADLIDALVTLDRDARPSNWSDEDQPGEPAHDAAAAWRRLDAVLAATKGGAQ